MNKRRKREVEFDNRLNEINEINRNILEYILTPNQVEVYLHLNKNGTKTALSISESLRISRTEIYDILNNLQQREIVTSAYGKPTKFNAVEIDDAITILIDKEIIQNKDT
jgi:HTH-type transcriptional regulator, sugar sensing transcriptional regulator